jgi:hypothetical protein
MFRNVFIAVSFLTGFTGLFFCNQIRFLKTFGLHEDRESRESLRGQLTPKQKGDAFAYNTTHMGNFNVLMLMLDGFRTELGAYLDTRDEQPWLFEGVKTPNIDKLANVSTQHALPKGVCTIWSLFHQPIVCFRRSTSRLHPPQQRQFMDSRDGRRKHCDHASVLSQPRVHCHRPGQDLLPC